MGCWKKIQSQSQVALVGYLGYYGAWDSYYTSPNSHFTISTDKLLCVRVGKVSSCFCQGAFASIGIYRTTGQLGYCVFSLLPDHIVRWLLGGLRVQ